MKYTKASYSSSSYEKSIKSSDRPPLIPHDGQLGWSEGEGLRSLLQVQPHPSV